jgi:hypothetical protein
VLENADFIAWSREHLVVLFAHNELGHPEDEGTDADGESTRRCTLYPGLSCRDHLDIEVAVTNSREAHLPRVPFVELCPNSWIILPYGGRSDVTGDAQDGSVVAVPEDEQFDARKLRKAIEAVQARLGPALDRKEGDVLLADARRLEEHLDEERLPEALAVLAAIEKRVGPKRPTSLGRWLLDAFDGMDEDVRTAFEDKASDGDVAAVQAWRDATAVTVLGRRLPALAEMDAWLAEHRR